MIVMGLFSATQVDGQQLIDPAPVADEPEVATDLPIPEPFPEHSLMVQQPARDNARPFFGVTFDPQARDAAVALSVSANSPADEAGVQAGDTIVSLNGRKMGTYDDVLRTIAGLKPGDVLDVEVSRRVVVRSRAVLNGAPAGFEHTTGYRVEAESLPAPAGYERQPVLRSPTNRPPASRVPANADAPRSRQGNSTPQNRNSNVDRQGNPNRNNDANSRERDDRGFRGFFRRRG
jgi:hypothetical protein